MPRNSGEAAAIKALMDTVKERQKVVQDRLGLLDEELDLTLESQKMSVLDVATRLGMLQKDVESQRRS